MNIKSLIEKMDQLSSQGITEGETKTTSRGKVHKGTYGTSYDGDDEDKKAEPEVKRGRGRPKKSGGDADTKAKYGGAKELQSWIVGNLPGGKLPGKPGKKHKLKDESINESAGKTVVIHPEDNENFVEQFRRLSGALLEPVPTEDKNGNFVYDFDGMPEDAYETAQEIISTSPNSNLEEETKTTTKGVVHKAGPGGYGRKFDTDSEDEDKEEKKPEVKRGRGRPKKSGGEADTKAKYGGAKELQSWIVGNLPGGKLPGKPGKKHKLKDWIEHVESKMLVEGMFNEGMSDVHMVLQDIVNGNLDLYDVLHHPRDEDQEYASKLLGQMYNEVASEHGSTDEDEILPLVIDRIAQDFGISIDDINLDDIDESGLGQKTFNSQEKDRLWAEWVKKARSENRPAIKNLTPEQQKKIKDKIWADMVRQARAENQRDFHLEENPNPQYTTEPLPGATAVKDATGNVVATAKTPQAAQAFKKGEVTLNVKEEIMTEKAPPGMEDTVLALKKKFPGQEGRAYAIAWDQYNKKHGKKEESVNESQHDRRKAGLSDRLQDILSNYPHEHNMAQEGWGLDEGLYEALCDHYHREGKIPRKVWHGTLEELRSFVEGCYTKDTTPVDEGLGGALGGAILGGAALGPMGAVGGGLLGGAITDEGLAGAALGGIGGALLTKTPAGASAGANIGSTIQDTLSGDVEESFPDMKQEDTPVWLEPRSKMESSLRQDVSNMKGSMMEGKQITTRAKKETFKRKTNSLSKSTDIQMESWESQLGEMLAEGMTITTSTGQQGVGDSISVSATDEDAQSLMQLLQNAGLDHGAQKPSAPTGVTSPVPSADRGPVAMASMPAGMGVSFNPDHDVEAVVQEPAASDEVLAQLSPEEDNSEDALTFLKRMIGARNGDQAQAADYSPEQSSGDESEDEICSGCGQTECECDDDGGGDEAELCEECGDEMVEGQEHKHAQMESFGRYKAMAHDLRHEPKGAAGKGSDTSGTWKVVRGDKVIASGLSRDDAENRSIAHNRKLSDAAPDSDYSTVVKDEAKQGVSEAAKWRQGYRASGHPSGFKHKSGEVGPLGGTWDTVRDYDDDKKVPVQKYRDEIDPLARRDMAGISTTGKPLLPRNKQKNLKDMIKRSKQLGPVGHLPEAVDLDVAEGSVDSKYPHGEVKYRIVYRKSGEKVEGVKSFASKADAQQYAAKDPEYSVQAYRVKQGVAEGLNEFAPDGFNGGGDSNDLQLYLNVAKKLNMKKYKPSTAHNLIAKKMAELVDVVDDDKVDYARHMARKAQGLPNMLEQGVAEGEGEKPDFLDLDKDQDRAESMKSAAKSAEESPESEDNLNEWANSRTDDQEERFMADIAFMTKGISGGLNGEKRNQTTLPSIQVVTDTEAKTPAMSMAALLKKLS